MVGEPWYVRVAAAGVAVVYFLLCWLFRSRRCSVCGAPVKTAENSPIVDQ